MNYQNELIVLMEISANIFQPKNSRDVQNLYRDKASTDMTPNEYFKYLTSTVGIKIINHLQLIWLNKIILIDIDLVKIVYSFPIPLLFKLAERVYILMWLNKI